MHLTSGGRRIRQHLGPSSDFRRRIHSTPPARRRGFFHSCPWGVWTTVVSLLFPLWKGIRDGGELAGPVVVHYTLLSRPNKAHSQPLTRCPITRENARLTWARTRTRLQAARVSSQKQRSLQLRPGYMATDGAKPPHACIHLIPAGCQK